MWESAVFLDKALCVVTCLGYLVSLQILIDIPGRDFMDIKDIPGFWGCAGGSSCQ